MVGAVCVILLLLFVLFRYPGFALVALALFGTVHHHMGVPIPAVITPVVDQFVRLQQAHSSRASDFTCSVKAVQAATQHDEDKLLALQSECDGPGGREH